MLKVLTALLSFISAVDAQSIGGGSGIGGTTATVAPPPVPSVAALAGYTSIKLNSPFTNLSNIDLNDTKQPGFQWYVNNSLPWYNLTDPVFIPQKSVAPQPPASFSIIGGNVLEIAYASGFASGLQTCVSLATPDAVGGHTYGGGWYAEVSAAYDPTASRVIDQSFDAWPFFGSWTIGLYNGSTTAAEIDTFEAFPGNTDGTIFEIATVHDYPTGANMNSNSGVNNTVVWNGTLSNQNTYGTLWWPSTKVGTPASTITAPTASTITDSLGNVWGFGASIGGGQYSVTFNGFTSPIGGSGDNIYLFLGAPWIHGSGGWFTYSGNNTSGVTAYVAQHTAPFASSFSSGGVGILQRYFNRVHLPGADVTYGGSYTPVPALMPNNPVGALAELDTQPSCFGMSVGPPSSFSGVPWPIFVKYVYVWGPP